MARNKKPLSLIPATKGAMPPQAQVQPGSITLESLISQTQASLRRINAEQVGLGNAFDILINTIVEREKKIVELEGKLAAYISK